MMDFLFFIKMPGQFLKMKNTFYTFVSTREIGAFNYMTWDQIKEISKEDFVEIGNHSHTHEYLADESNELIKKILLNQFLFLKKILEKF